MLSHEEKYDFLSSFFSRIRTIAPLFITIQGCLQLTFWNAYGYRETENEKRLELVFYILLFIRMKSLNEQPCTIEMIAELIGAMEQYCLGQDTQERTKEEYIEFAKRICYGVFLNNGKPNRISCFDHEKNERQSITVSIITMNSVPNGPDTIRLDKDGYAMTLMTKEVEDQMHVEMDTFMVMFQLSKSNYSGALDTAADLYERLKKMQQNIEEEINSIRSDVLSYTTDRYSKTMTDAEKVLQESNSRLKNVRRSLNEKTKTIREHECDVSENDTYKQLDILERTSNYILKCIDTSLYLIRQNSEVSQQYHKALREALDRMSTKSLSFKNDIFSKAVSVPYALGSIEQLFYPLFAEKTERIFSPESCVSLLCAKTTESQQERMVLEMADEESMKKAQIEKEEKFEQTVAVLLPAYRKLSEKKKMRFGEMLQEIQCEDSHILQLFYLNLSPWQTERKRTKDVQDAQDVNMLTVQKAMRVCMDKCGIQSVYSEKILPAEEIAYEFPNRQQRTLFEDLFVNIQEGKNG